MNPADSHLRFVKWSDEDPGYLSRSSNAKPDTGYCPDLFYGSVCHGEAEEATDTNVRTVSRDEINDRLAKVETLPKPSVRATRDLDFAAA